MSNADESELFECDSPCVFTRIPFVFAVVFEMVIVSCVILVCFTFVSEFVLAGFNFKQ